MDNIKQNKFFLLIGLKKIKFAVLNENNQIFLDKKFLANDSTLEENFKTLRNFLDQNILDLEKKLNHYINEIDLIIDYEDFLTVDVSSIHNFKNYADQSSNGNSSSFLINIKDNVIKDMNGYDLTHMTINKFIIDGKEYSLMPNDCKYQSMLLEIRFIYLKSDILQNLKKIFSKYEILVKNVSCYKHVNHFKNSEVDNIFDLADKLKNGFNQKEILSINKSTKSIGFFEKFFNLFS